MRLHKRHAWGAVLIALFALPVLQPDGVPMVEEPTAGAFTWASKIPALNPRMWSSTDEGDAEFSERARALERELVGVWERYHQLLERVKGEQQLQDALGTSGLDRLPKSLVARVLRAHDPVSFRRSLLIDRGSDDGVEVGQAVVMGRVYVGRVRVVHGRSALVQLVTDPRSRIEVFVRTDKGSLLRGFAQRSGSRDGYDEMRIKFVRLRSDTEVVEVGAPVFTSNFDERVPAHLLVGAVSSVSDPDLDRMPLLTMRPALDLDRSTEVIVLLPPDPAGAVGPWPTPRAPK